MKITVLETGEPSPEDIARFGTYATMIERWLRPLLPEATFASVKVKDGEPVPAPRPDEGYIITGSSHGVYERLPWMERLEAFIREARDIGAPVAGLCFGHQIMASAYGGTVEKSERGWGVGRTRYRIDPALTGGAADIPVLHFHQDQVVVPPPEARPAGGTEHCPYGVFTYPFAALSVQFHPEFPADYVTVLLERNRGGKVPADVADAALAEMPKGHDPETIGRLFAGFFREHLGTMTQRNASRRPAA